MPTYTPSPSLKATATPTPRPTVPTPTSVPTPVPTEYEILQQPDPVLRHLAAKQHLLERTNDEREKAGVPTVKMGENPAAQLHAEAALRGCYSSHWDRWGLKPNARYVLSGGTGSDGENLIGSSYCITSRDFYTPLDPIEVEIDEAVQSWIESPGHQANMLNPSYTELNLGIAYDRYNIVMVQHFASDYVSYEKPPAIDDRGRLSLKGKVEGATMEIGDVSSLIIGYDPPPRMLARGQLARTYALCAPTRIGYLLKPLPPGWTYEPPRDRSKELRIVPGCIDPYKIDPDRDAPSSPQEAWTTTQIAKLASSLDNMEVGQLKYDRIIADRLDVSNTSFDIRADLSALVDEHGPGIYTIWLWGRPSHMDRPAVLAEQSIFWMTEPPERNPYEAHRER